MRQVSQQRKTMFTAISHFIYTKTPLFLRTAFNRDGFVLYARNIQWVAVWKILTTLFSLITTMVVARLLGPEQFGILNYVLSVVGLFSVIGTLGIGYIVYDEIVKHKEDRQRILGSSIALTLLTGGVAFLLVCFYLYFFNETLYTKSLILLMAFSFFTVPFSYLHLDFLKDKEGKFVAITQTATTLLGGILKILSVFLFASLHLFITILVLENIFAGCLYIYQIKFIKKRSVLFYVSKEKALAYFLRAIPLTALAALSEIYYRIDQVLLKHMVGTTAVGLYATAVRLTEIWYIVPNILIASLFPALSHASQESMGSEYSKRFRMFLGVLMLIALIIMIGASMFGGYFITFVYGTAFREASLLLSVYITSLPGSFVAMLIMQDFFLKKKTWYMVLFASCTASVNVIACLIFIPIYGPLGAALATTISYNITPVLYYCRRLFLK